MHFQVATQDREEEERLCMCDGRIRGQFSKVSQTFEDNCERVQEILGRGKGAWRGVGGFPNEGSSRWEGERTRLSWRSRVRTSQWDTLSEQRNCRGPELRWPGRRCPHYWCCNCAFEDGAEEVRCHPKGCTLEFACSSLGFLD